MLALQKESAVIAFDGHLGRLSRHEIFVQFLIIVFIVLPALVSFSSSSSLVVVVIAFIIVVFSAHR